MGGTLLAILPELAADTDKLGGTLAATVLALTADAQSMLSVAQHLGHWPAQHMGVVVSTDLNLVLPPEHK